MAAVRYTFPNKGWDKVLKKFYTFLDAVPNLMGTYETVSTGASPTALDVTVRESKITSGGTADNESVTIADGTYVGQKKQVTLTTRTNASDVIVLPYAKILNAAGTQATGVTIGTAGGFVFLDWTGSKWKIIYSASATIAP